MAYVCRKNSPHGVVPVWQRVLDPIFPQFCAVCGCRMRAPEGRSVCPGCLNASPFLSGPLCGRCGMPNASATALAAHGCRYCRRRRLWCDRADSAFSYNPVMRIIIHQLKYGRKPALAEPLAKRLAVFLADRLPLRGIDAVTPVPLHRQRERDRGFNQAHHIAENLARLLDLPYRASLIQRVRCTARQSMSSPEQRARNIAAAFRVRSPGQVRGRTILVVDDVLTTGATLNECGRMLKNAGATRVYAATLARTVSS